MNNFAHDIRVALRGFRRTPAFVATVIVILGAGIGTAVAMFTIFRAVLVEPLPVRDVDRVVVLTTFRDSAVEFGLTLGNLKELNRASNTLNAVAGFAHWGATPSPMLDGDRPVTLNRVIASGNFFDVLDARPRLGRLLLPADADPGAEHVLVLSYKAWRKTFGGDTTVVGHRLLEPYSQWTYTIVGVAPPGLAYPEGADFWIPTGLNADGLSIIAIGRMNAGVTASAARSEFFSIVQRTNPGRNLIGAHAVPFTQAVLGDVRPVLRVLTAAVALLLIIACVNVGNLLLLRAGSRAHEVAVRRALGATYGDIVRQLLLENGLLAVGGGVLGLIVGEMLLRILIAFAPAQLPRVDVIQISGAPIAAAIGVTVLAVMMFGVGPALMSASGNVATTLRLDSRSGGDSGARRRVRTLLVASQTALAIIVLAGAALLTRSLSKLERIDLGYNADSLAFLSVSWPAQKLAAGPQLYPMGEELTRRWRAIPGIVAVTPTVVQPMLGPSVFVSKMDMEGQTPEERATNAWLPWEEAGEGYFRTFGIPLRRGRGFTDSDRDYAPLVVVVSDAVARRTWRGEDAIGKRDKFLGSDSAWRTVIGVAGDVHLRTLRESTPEVYVPWRQAGFWQNNFAVRTAGSLASVIPALRRELRAVDPTLALWYMTPMQSLLDAPLAKPRMTALLMSGFGAAALLLAALGLYGMMASVVREGTREIGIRMALGATPERVRRSVLRQALITCGIGALVGIAGALALSRLLASQLYEVSPSDPVSLIGACAILLGVALMAAYLPARRATWIDPARALRAD